MRGQGRFITWTNTLFLMGLAIPLHGTWDGLRTDFLGMDVEVEVSLEVEPATP